MSLKRVKLARLNFANAPLLYNHLIPISYKCQKTLLVTPEAAMLPGTGRAWLSTQMRSAQASAIEESMIRSNWCVLPLVLSWWLRWMISDRSHHPQASFPTGARRALVRPSSDLSSAQLLDGVTHSLGHTSIREDNVDFPWPPRGQASYEGDDHDNLHQSLRPSSTLMHLQLASTRSRTATSLSGTGILEEPLAFDGAAKRAQFREVDGEFPVDRHVFSRDDVQHLETMFETDRHLGRAVRSEYRGAGVAGGIGAPGHSAQRIIPQSSSDSAAVNELLSAENDIRRQTVKEGKQASRQAYTDEPGPLSDDVLQGLRQEYSSRDRNLHGTNLVDIYLENYSYFACAVKNSNGTCEIGSGKGRIFRAISDHA